MGTDNEHLLGRFWLAEQPDRQLTGWLDLSGPRPTVALNGQLTPAVEWKPTADGRGATGHLTDDGLGTDRAVTIHGRLAEGPQKAVTIFGAITMSRKYNVMAIGDDADGVHVLRGTSAARGGHLEPNEEIVAASMRFTNLNEWIRLNGVESQIISKPHNSVSITYNEPCSQSALVPTIEGTISTRFVSLPPNFEFNGVWVGHKAWIFFDNLKNSTLESFLAEYAQPVLTLASVMMKKKCYITELSITTKKDDWSLKLYHPIVHRKATDLETKPGNNVLTLQDVGIDVVAKWISRAGPLNPIPNIVYSAIGDGSSRTLESRVLELAAAAEGFDRRKHGDEAVFDKAAARQARRVAYRCTERVAGKKIAERIRDSLNHFNAPTYGERLHRLLLLTENATPGIAGDWKKWVKHVKEARNGYAHQLERSEKSWEVELILLESLKWVLEAAILIEAGVSPEIIAKHLASDQDYLFFKRKAKALAPQIYGDS